MANSSYRYNGFKLFLRSLAVPAGNPNLNIAQFKAFSKQVPILYLILLTNMVALSWTHWDVSPLWLTLLMPGLFGIACIVRTVGWVRNRGKEITPEMAFRRLIATNRLAAPIAIFCVSWSLALLRDGDAYQQAHVVFFMAITVIGIIFCLMHLRSAALVVAVTVNLPFFVAMMLTGKATFIAAGFNVLLVTGAMIAIVVTHYRDFRQLHESRQVLLTQQEKLQALSDENLRLANLDSLTSIANRRSFFAALEEAFNNARRNGSALAVGIIDLDGFKPINDMYGHAAGDKVLVEVAERLQHAARPDLRVFRLGGDEFALLNTGDCAEKELTRIGEAICQAIAARMDVGGRSVQVTGSMGFAVFPALAIAHRIFTSGQTTRCMRQKGIIAPVWLFSMRTRRRGWIASDRWKARCWLQTSIMNCFFCTSRFSTSETIAVLVSRHLLAGTMRHWGLFRRVSLYR